jgi:hypothetical protein
LAKASRVRDVDRDEGSGDVTLDRPDIVHDASKFCLDLREAGRPWIPVHADVPLRDARGSPPSPEGRASGTPLGHIMPFSVSFQSRS